MTAIDLGVVVIGSGRSGTAWAAHRLTESGVPCGHESVFDWHPSSDPSRRLDYPGRTPSEHEPPPDVELRAESSLAAIAHLAHLPARCHVWHVVRDPRDVIASWAGSGILTRPAETPYGRFMLAHVPAIDAEPLTIGRAARWVAEWNLRGAAATAALGLTYERTQVEQAAAEVVYRHRDESGIRRRLTWADVDEASTDETLELLDAWAHLAGYAHRVAPGDTVAV